MTAGERQQVRNAVAAYFGGVLVTSDAGAAYQGGPLTQYGLGTAYPYAPKGIPDAYFWAGAPAGRGYGMVLGTEEMERATDRMGWGGPTSGWRIRGYTITCKIEMQAQEPHIETAAAALDDLIDEIEALIFADRTLGTTNAALYPVYGRLLVQAGEKPYGVRDSTTPMVPVNADRGRYWGSGRLSFTAVTMVSA